MLVSDSLEKRNATNPEWALAQRVVASPDLRTSPKLCKFFLYIVDCYLRDAPEDASEQQIGVHVFHRKPGYNSSDDSIVRSQARLLRLKLAGYFADAGSHEEIIIEIPKGHYLPVFHPAAQKLLRSEATALEDSEPVPVEKVQASIAVEVPEPTVSVKHPRRVPILWMAIVSVGVALGVLLGFAWGRGLPLQHNSSADLFWKPFLKGAPPLVIYSNPLFTGRPYTGMRLVTPDTPRSPNETVDDTYTGTGEASAIRDLTRVFDAHHAEFILKRSRLLTWDEAKSHNLIFIGAASQNGALQDLRANSDFGIDLDSDHQGFISNRHPRPGEPAQFKPGSANDEYAIIALVPGIDAGTRVAIFTGLTTNGTQAAVEFVCNPNSAQQLVKALGKQGDAFVPFESVLHIKMSGGVPLQADIAAIHTHP
ncbi:MAG TPA: hypothetical protein VGG18_00430 [Granulicella sp.]|jgi:hypothetical protein